MGLVWCLKTDLVIDIASLQKYDSTDVSKSDQANKSTVSILGSVNQEFNNAAGQFLAEIIKSIHT